MLAERLVAAGNGTIEHEPPTELVPHLRRIMGREVEAKDANSA